MELLDYLQDVKVQDESWTFDSGLSIGILHLYRLALRVAAREYNLREPQKISQAEIETIIDQMIRSKYIELSGLSTEQVGTKSASELILEEDTSLNEDVNLSLNEEYLALNE